ncbi:hypothetical protein IVA95_23495 [Bradyrhizobium sp. 157]|uniref:DUF6161 domain-containing protein n=1 Tax=Bradyrhizobium sp. 157 TaxID=2782631 RepID=UPI001FF9A515|nr:DUF6161 domain-containing protein [Bradyrhizobium sp. 157]MCK1640467.1 hypothetical protein [Bradyrhizobium sp. 157]
MAKSKNDPGSWLISIPTQGIQVSGSTDTILRFLNEELAYYSRLGFNGTNLTLASQSYGSVNLSNRAQGELTSIIEEVRQGKTDALQQYIDQADQRLVLVGASRMGKQVEQMKELSPAAACMLACIHCWNWTETSHPTGRELILLFRSIAFANPAIFAFNDLLATERVMKESKLAWQATKEECNALDAFVKEKTELFGVLEDRYRNQLTIQEPAVSWEKITAQKAKLWRLWLGIFALMVIAPIIVAIAQWESVSGAVSKLTANSNGTFSIAGLAVVSIPALFYAWLLKNVSRVFIQNLNLADDADHRRSLALTYMGLLENAKRETTDAERAIVLNALFRPIPPQTNDEGPPAGVIDLIKKN